MAKPKKGVNPFAKKGAKSAPPAKPGDKKKSLPPWLQKGKAK